MAHLNKSKMIKKSILITLNLILSISIFGQINNPNVTRREVTYCDITKIEINSTNTIVHFKYKAPSTYVKGGWVCAGKDFFIRDSDTKKIYNLIKANNIPICPEKHNFDYQGQTLDFNLVFQPIPSNTKQIDIIEDEAKGGFNFYGVELITANNFTQGTKTLKSDGKFRKTDSPLSDVISIIPAGTSVKVLSFSGGYYKAEYKGQVGYLSELYFQSSGIGSKSSKSSSYSSHSSSSSKSWNEYNLKEHWKTNGMDRIEGIYESTGSYKDVEVPCVNGYGQTICYMTWRRYEPKYKLALLKSAGEYKLIYLSGKPKGSEKVGGCNCDGKSYIAPDSSPWKVGDTKARLHKTATPDFYKCDWYMGDKSLNPDGYITFENYAYFTLILSGSESMYLKLYPTADDNIARNNRTEKSSGTGFAITSNGLIATNHHVVDGAKTIKVRGINNDFNRTYSAKLVITDKNNDLAIIKIDDYSFSSLGTIPYTINSTISNVGENIFVMGYPLRATMGDEVKLTNGIVSSKTGFQGDVTSYQISAPVQPGNSGGPLFNSKGQLIGIINAKHLGAENASYAVKSSYLTNLIDLLDYPPTLQSISSVSGMPLTQQVQIIKKFVYIIEVE
jgi:S1-C subfamily serine protease